ncbi:MAG: response regulator [Candidatus Brocadiae bacterium]|nr:response regulator [Candidatus Brocadiia bacterium]
MVTAAVIVSLLLQLTAAALSLRLIRVTGRRSAWILIASAILLMAVRRGITLFRILSGDETLLPDPAVEGVALAISAFMAVGIALIGPLFEAHNRSAAALAASEGERRKLEARMLQAQKMEALGRLAGGVAHDFNNLLTIVLGYADEAIRRLPADDPLQKNLTEIRGAGRRAADLTRQLLAFSRHQPVQAALIDLNDVVSKTEAILRRVLGEDIRLLVTAAPAPALILADAGQIDQVLVNLAVNARDAMPAGGMLRIGLSHVDAPDQSPSGQVVLTVQDTGCGMSPDVRARIFEPFFTTKPAGKGTGLGLMTVYGIVTQFAGTIQVDSAPGEGTTFRIAFPAGSGEQVRAGSGVRAPAPAAAATVLVVEDEAAILRLVAATLRGEGHTVLEAADGQAALAAARDCPGPIDLLITDSVMPHMSGGELSRTLAQERPGLRVLVVSGYLETAASESPDTPFLRKPFTPDDLLRKVEEVLRSQGPAAPPAAGA